MSLYRVIGYHVIFSEGHMIANDSQICYMVPITPYKETLVPHLVAILIYLSQNYSYYIRGDRSPLTLMFLKYCTLLVLRSTLDVEIWRLQTSDSDINSRSPQCKPKG